ncbi:MAG TPA: hypothetical protein VG013_13865, partial [Gemmataceae bacterium]|nr:hypothetical protein [Gemmataceae bacterium]
SGCDGSKRPPVVLPPPVIHRPPRGPTYAFLVHPTCPEDVAVTNPGLRRLSAGELRRFCGFIASLPPVVVLRAPTIRSPRGPAADGFIITLPLLPAEMARRGLKSVSRQIAQAVDLAAMLGAQVVGLGGHTTPFSRRGLAVIGRGPAITTGNVLTAGMAFAATRQLAEQRQGPLTNARVAVVGARGSVGSLCARLFARARPRRLLLVGNPATGTAYVRRLGRELDGGAAAVEVTTDLCRLGDCDIVVTATGAARPVLDEAPLAPGTIVCDIARPPDTATRLRTRRDVVVIEGGPVALPDPTTRFGAGNILGLPDGVQVACLAETILLALECTARHHGIGQGVGLAAVDAIMAIAERHGFRLAPAPPACVGQDSNPDTLSLVRIPILTHTLQTPSARS